MLTNTLFIVLFCFSIASINGLERCPGASDDSQEDLPWKYNASSIVVYGTVTEVTGNTVTFKINCALKGQIIPSTIQLNQVSNVVNTSECHYLTTNKNYIVFLEPLKSAAFDNKISYQLANMEEIEITPNSLTKFLDDECSDEDDYGTPMTILYADSNNKCNKFQAICTENTKTSILNLNYPPLSKTSTFLGGIKNTLEVPNMDETENGMILSKQGFGTDDGTFRSTATISTIFMPIVVIITSLTMIF